MVTIPEKIFNWIGGHQVPPQSAQWIEKLNPATGKKLCELAASGNADVATAVALAKQAQPSWGQTPGVVRGEYLHKIVLQMIQSEEALAQIVHLETGKSLANARGEVKGAIQLGLFYASEGQRLYGRTTTSSVPHKMAMTIRQPIGVAGLIIAANTPIANVAWKLFPALICGNAVVLKAAEDTPITAWFMGDLIQKVGFPDGVVHILQGLGAHAGEALVKHPDIGVISFTGSTAVGQRIQALAGPRLARISLELGGKNPFVVCEDANLENAVQWATLSAFSNAGQRCASGSRIILVDSVYQAFRQKFLDRVAKINIGTSDTDDYGSVINLRQLEKMLSAIDAVKKRGAHVMGGNRLMGAAHREGFFLEPTVIENVGPEDALSREELFGPVTVLYRVKDYAEGLDLANDNPYGLTAAIHTKNFDRAMHFCQNVASGVVTVNGGTFGSEPHMPFGGRKLSGNGSREPGTEALNIYSELKDVYLNVNSGEI